MFEMENIATLKYVYSDLVLKLLTGLPTYLSSF